MSAEEYTRRLAAGLKPDTGTVHDPGDGSIPTYFPGPGETDATDDDLDAPLTPEEEERLAKREPAEGALLAAEAAAAQAGETGLGKCLACLGVLWDIGAIEYAARALGRVREGAMQAVREADIGDEPDYRTRAKAEAWDALTEHAAHAGAELNTPEVGEELRLLRELEQATFDHSNQSRYAAACGALRAFRERTGTQPERSNRAASGAPGQ